jgi:iron complex outermembrane receptor protein
VPASIDVIDGATIRDGQPAINLSEPLVRVPGVFAANRNNYAQDLQISSRGYGSRATFGVRGVRLYQDFIPRPCPTARARPEASACSPRRASKCCAGRSRRSMATRPGGVISVFTEDPATTPVVEGHLELGSFNTYNAGLKASGIAGAVGYLVAANRFDTDGYREHSGRAARTRQREARVRTDRADAR